MNKGTRLNPNKPPKKHNTKSEFQNGVTSQVTGYMV